MRADRMIPVSVTEQLRSALSDRYTIERELGRGGMAIVYLARDLRHERPVALKVLRADLGAALGPERFTQEIKLARCTSSIRSPRTRTSYWPSPTSPLANSRTGYTMPGGESSSISSRTWGTGR